MDTLFKGKTVDPLPFCHHLMDQTVDPLIFHVSQLDVQGPASFLCLSSAMPGVLLAPL